MVWISNKYKNSSYERQSELLTCEMRHVPDWPDGALAPIWLDAGGSRGAWVWEYSRTRMSNIYFSPAKWSSVVVRATRSRHYGWNNKWAWVKVTTHTSDTLSKWLCAQKSAILPEDWRLTVTDGLLLKHPNCSTEQWFDGDTGAELQR